MIVVGPGGQKEIGAEEFFIGPNVDITRMTVLEDGEMLTAIRLSAEWSGARFYFEKVADRNTWDFPLVNVAAAMKVTGAAGAETIESIRIAAGAVQCVPRRLTVVEEVVKGQAKNAETAALAGQSAVRGATPLNFNHFKIPLLQNLVMRAVRDA
jgi:xanthine dehydrogenase YagS FAD-binding subunit